MSNNIINWNDYSRSFMSVMPSAMVSLNKTVANQMSGCVVDYGAGGGKLARYILNETNVHEYIGVDMSKDMVNCARIVANQFPQKKSIIIQSSIETCDIGKYADSAASINSFYCWANPSVVLKRIFEQLNKEGIFVLATINKQLDMKALLAEAEIEQFDNPLWEEFKKHNMDIMASKHTNLVTLDELIKLVQRVGFEVTEAHTHFYNGGLNYLILHKPL